VLALILLFSSGLFAQTKLIRGVVLGAENKQPLEGATVVVNRSEHPVVTNSQGRFEVELSQDKALLTISFVGREPYETEVKAGQPELTILSMLPAHRCS